MSIGWNTLECANLGETEKGKKSEREHWYEL